MKSKIWLCTESKISHCYTKIKQNGDSFMQKASQSVHSHTPISGVLDRQILKEKVSNFDFIH